MMTAGDAALQAEITALVLKEISDRIAREPKNWWTVSEAADLYVKYYNFIRNKRAQNEILSPLHLDGQSLLANQKTMSDRLVNDLAKELLAFELPNVATIFAGIDLSGSHIYSVHNNEVNCVDNVGFAAIGIGARHASSQFMFARHAWNSPFPETLLLTYYAKRKAEVAPGVGIGTEMVMAGPHLGSLMPLGVHVIKKLDQEYRKIIRSEATAFTSSKNAMAGYVVELAKEAEAVGASAVKQTPAEPDDGAPSPHKPKA
jgi:hypothetical protein